MTREEKQKAIDVLKISAPVMAMTQEEFDVYIQTINQVMDWLEQETVSKESYDHEYFLRKELETKISKLEQEPKTGHWYIDERPESDREVICSNCEQPIFKYHKIDFDYRPNYCPNCGCRMVEPQERNDKE